MHGQDVLDLVIVLVLVGFAIRGLLSGLINEVAGLLAIVGGFLVAHAFHPVLAPHLLFIGDPAWRSIAAYVILFVGVMLVVAIVARIVRKLVALAFALWVDRLAGGIFGLAKGVLLLSLVMLALRRFFYDAAFIQQSRALPYLDAMMSLLRSWLPPDVVTRLGL